ncbi:MAG: AGE family epimerase/isomerase, partial [Bacillota bacterium]
KPELHCLLESVGMDGAFHSTYSAGRVVNPGHSMEAAWFLLNEFRYYHDNVLLEISQNIFDWSIDIGWDKEYGGILYYTDILGCPPEQYEHDMKLWWPHCEALIASLMLYRYTGKQIYADWFETIGAYCFDVFSDPQSGDWYGYLRRDGKPTQPACKGSTYKSGFHLIRMLSMVERMLNEMLREQETSGH